MFVLAAASLIVLGIGADITADTSLASNNVGLLVTAFALPYAVIAPLFQLCAGGRFAPRTIIVTGALLLGAGMILTSISNGTSALLASRALTATGAALIAPSTLAMATFLVSPEQRGRATAAVYLGFTLASVVGIPIGAQLAQLFGWRSAFLSFAVAAFFLAVLTWTVLPSMKPAGVTSFEAARDLFKNEHALYALGLAASQLAAQFMVLAPIATMLILHFGLDEVLLPAVLLAFGLSGVLGNHVGGIWSDRLPLGLSLRIALAGLALTLFALSMPLGGYLAAGAFALLAFFGTLFRPPQIVLLTRLIDDDARTLALGLNTSAAYLGLTLGSAASAAVIAGLGFSALGWLALSFVCIAALLIEILKYKAQL